jgi:hypothetical protein
VPVKGQPISSGAYGQKVREALIDLDARVAGVSALNEVVGYFSNTGTVASVTTSAITVGTVSTKLEPGFSYEFTARAQISVSATLDFVPQIQRPDTTVLIDYGRQLLSGSGDRFYHFTCGFRTTTSFTAATAGLIFKASTSTGTATVKGFSTGPFELMVRKIGLYDSFPGQRTY